jgi:hypothetical protein
VGLDMQYESEWAGAFVIFKCAVTTHVIAARRALRQTSNATAEGYADQMVPYSEFAYRTVQDLIHRGTSKYKI